MPSKNPHLGRVLAKQGRISGQTVAAIELPEPFAADAYARAIATALQRLPQMRAAAAAESRRLLSLQGRWLTVITDTVEQFAAATRQAP